MKRHPVLFLLTIFVASGLFSVLGAIGTTLVLAFFPLTNDTGTNLTLLGVVPPFGYFIGGLVGAALAFQRGTIPTFPERAGIMPLIILTLLAYIGMGVGLTFFEEGRSLLMQLGLAMSNTFLRFGFPPFLAVTALIPTCIAALALWRARRIQG